MQTSCLFAVFCELCDDCDPLTYHTWALLWWGCCIKRHYIKCPPYLSFSLDVFAAQYEVFIVKTSIARTAYVSWTDRRNREKAASNGNIRNQEVDCNASDLHLFLPVHTSNSIELLHPLLYSQYRAVLRGWLRRCRHDTPTSSKTHCSLCVDCSSS